MLRRPVNVGREPRAASEIGTLATIIIFACSADRVRNIC